MWPFKKNPAPADPAKPVEPDWLVMLHAVIVQGKRCRDNCRREYPGQCDTPSYRCMSCDRKD